MSRRLLAVSVLAAALVPAASASAGRVLGHDPPPGFRATRAGSEISLALPQRWAALDQRAAAVPGVAQTLAKTNRGLAPYLAELAVPASPLRLVAFDPAVQGGWATATVLSTPLDRPGLRFGEWSAGVVRAVQGLARVEGPVAARRVSLDAGDAIRLAYVQDAGGRRLATTMFVVRVGGRLYTVTYSVPTAVAGDYRGIFDASARTLVVGSVLHAPPA